MSVPKRTLLSTYLLALASLSTIALTRAQTTEYCTLDRKYEPVVIRADSLNVGAFIGAPISQLFLLAYDGASAIWREIPFQVDERDGTGEFRFSGANGVLDGDDEFVFMARDLGDHAVFYNWLNDPDARANYRYEIEIRDPRDASKKAWCYLYRSTTFTPRPDLVDYLSYRAARDGTAADTVISSNYVVAHAANGINNCVKVPVAVGGSETDFFDRMKLRMFITASPPIVGKVEVRVTEEANVPRGRIPIPPIDGRVRVIRKLRAYLEAKVSIPLYTYTYRDSVDFSTVYYPFSFVLGVDKNIPPIDYDGAVRYVRYSNDLNSNAASAGTNMRFICSKNAYKGGAIIDGQMDGVSDSFRTTLNVPGDNWFIHTGAHGTILNIMHLTPTASANTELYYFDRSSGGTADLMPDTGDLRSYGDAGVRIGDSRSNSTSKITYLKISSTTYYLGGNPNPTQKVVDSLKVFADQITSESAQPLRNAKNLLAQSQRYDAIPPFAVSDLGATSLANNAIQLTWSAPRDQKPDGTTGKVASYELRYSPIPPIAGDTLTWWNEDAVAVGGLPTPSDPGAFEITTVPNLSTNTTYYFVLRSKDDFGNTSPFSNVALGTAVPVELASFEAASEADRVTLRWTTATESDNFGFEVERRTLSGEREGWSAIGFVRGHGTTTVPHQYVFTDRNLAPGSYSYRLKQIDTDGAFTYSNERRVEVTSPTRFTLQQNYPNPFNPATVIRYEIPERSPVSLRILNLLGQEIALLVNETKDPGYYSVTWDGTDMFGQPAPNGIYFYELRASSGAFRAVRKMTLMR